MTTDTAIHIEQLRIAYHDALCTFALAEGAPKYGTGVAISKARSAYENAVIDAIRSGEVLPDTVPEREGHLQIVTSYRAGDALHQHTHGVQIPFGAEPREVDRAIELMLAEMPDALRLAGVSDLALE